MSINVTTVKDYGNGKKTDRSNKKQTEGTKKQIEGTKKQIEATKNRSKQQKARPLISNYHRGNELFFRLLSCVRVPPS
jgi:hypothetical protein